MTSSVKSARGAFGITFRRLAIWIGVTLLLSAGYYGRAQIAIPTPGTRGEVPQALLDGFTQALRQAVTSATGLSVSEGELITSGIAGSLEPEFATLIAELDGVRYAISGEIRPAPTPATSPPFIVSLLVVDAEQNRSTDLITQPLDITMVEAVAARLAQIIRAFTMPVAPLPSGNAGLFVSSEPREADIFVQGVHVGRTGELDVLMLAPGRYELETRKEGFLPETRAVELKEGDTKFVHIPLTAISGGSVQISSSPAARVFLDGELKGRTPITLPALPGLQALRLEREGFKTKTVFASVRNYRVTRVDINLEPVRTPLVFWREAREYLVFVDGVLQPGGFAANLEPGRSSFEIRRSGEVRSYRWMVPKDAVLELDLQTGELLPLQR